MAECNRLGGWSLVGTALCLLLASSAPAQDILFSNASGDLTRGIARWSTTGSILGDYDNDGWLDAVQLKGNFTTGTTYLGQVRVLHNKSEGRFVPDANILEPAMDVFFEARGIGAGTADYDNDGDVDLYLPRALISISGSRMPH